jgi:hypothetical protein
MAHTESTTDIPHDQVANVVAGYLASLPPPTKAPERTEQPNGDWTVVATFPQDGPDRSSSHRAA